MAMGKGPSSPLRSFASKSAGVQSAHAGAQEKVASSQLVPVKSVALHSQRAVPSSAEQVPPFKQGLGSQGDASASQVSPSKPSAHWHVKEACRRCRSHR